MADRSGEGDGERRGVMADDAELRRMFFAAEELEQLQREVRVIFADDPDVLLGAMERAMTALVAAVALDADDGCSRAAALLSRRHEN